MSRRVSANRKIHVEAPECSVCVQHGLPMNFAMSHSLRDRNGKICCPTVLNNVCSNCYNTGHFPKYCTTKSFSEKLSTAAERRREHAIKEVAKPEAKTTKNAFADLAEDSSDEEVAEPSTPKKEAKSSAPGAPKKKPVDWADWSDSEDEE